jgi:Zn-finger nucleic acid-binding protein
MQWAFFWNLCPKCGGDMFEQKALQTCFDVCRDCHGVYFEAAELKLALKHHDAKKLLNAVLKTTKKPRIK